MGNMTNSPSDISARAPATVRSWWHEPRSYGGTLTLFVISYLLWQPFAAAVLPRVVGTPRIDGPAAWQVFVLVLPVLGVIAGSLWWLGGQRRPGGLRYWLRSTGRMLGLSTMLMAARTGTEPIAIWCAVVVITAALMGFLFGWMERWELIPEHHTPPA